MPNAVKSASKGGADIKNDRFGHYDNFLRASWAATTMG